MRAGIQQITERSARLAAAIRKRIITMELPPGAPLDEQELAEEFKLSRPPIRELIRQMAGEGFAELELGRPARVMPLGYTSLREFFLVAPLILTLTTQLATEKSTPDDIKKLRSIDNKYRESIKKNDLNNRIFNEYSFFYAMGEVSENPYVLHSLRRCLIDYARMSREIYGHIGRSIKNIDKSHEEECSRRLSKIITEIEEKSTTGVERVLKEYFESLRVEIAELTTPSSLSVESMALKKYF